MNRRVILAAMAAAAIAVAAIAALVYRANAPQEHEVPLRSYSVAADERELTMTAQLTRLDQIVSVTADESANSVKVTVVARKQRGTAPSDILFVDVRVTLTDPLGDRAVLDGNGDPVQLRN